MKELLLTLACAQHVIADAPLDAQTDTTILGCPFSINVVITAFADKPLLEQSLFHEHKAILRK